MVQFVVLPSVSDKIADELWRHKRCNALSHADLIDRSGKAEWQNSSHLLYSYATISYPAPFPLFPVTTSRTVGSRKRIFLYFHLSR